MGKRMVLFPFFFFFFYTGEQFMLRFMRLHDSCTDFPNRATKVIACRKFSDRPHGQFVLKSIFYKNQQSIPQKFVTTKNEAFSLVHCCYVILFSVFIVFRVL